MPVIVVIVAVVVVVVVAFLVLVVGVLLERPALAQRFEVDTLRRRQLHHQRFLSEVGDRSGQGDLLVFVDQEDDARLLQRRGVGGTHAEGVRRLGAADDQMRLADAGHDRAHQ